MRRKDKRVARILGLAAACLLIALSGHAMAQDPEVGLADAEARAAAAEAEIPELEAAVRSAQSRFRAAKQGATPIRTRAREAAARVTAMEDSRRSSHRQAIATVGQIEEERDNAKEEHDGTARAGLGIGIAAFVMAVIALAWGWFRASAGVAYLARIQLSQAIGLCVGIGLLAVIIGAIINSVGGAVGVLGFAIFSLGLSLPVAFLLARHSAEVQRECATPLLGRKRLPARATQAIAALLACLFIVGLASAVFAGEASSRDISARLREEAQQLGASTPALAAARGAKVRLKSQADAAAAVVRRKQAVLTDAKQELGQTETRLAGAEGDERNFARRLVAIEARETREREHEEREYEDALQEEEELTAEECDPNYSGCLDPSASDYDCEGGSGDGPLYTGTVEVLGVDHYGLDDDGDGIGCDP
jgi:hypothetical protein